MPSQMPVRACRALLLVTLALACQDNFTAVLPPCTASANFHLRLAVGEYRAVDPALTLGCAVFDATSASQVEYLVVPQSASGEPGRQSTFALQGERLGGSGGGAAALVAGGRPATPAERFHAFLRQGEAQRYYGSGTPAPGFRAPELRTAVPRPRPGDMKQFSVCATVTCSRFDLVTAEARAVGNLLAIFVDVTAPANGLNDADLDSLVQLFDTRLYQVDVDAFGAVSDINGDSTVLVLMTPTVNRLVTQAECEEGGFVAGFFLGGDIDPLFQGDARVNHAEVFYSLVADPDSTLPSCAHSIRQVKRAVAVTFVHEFQHMISFNQHVLLRRGPSEILWLNEGLSHYAEELGGRSLPIGDSLRLAFFAGNWLNAYAYWDATFAYALLPGDGIGSLAERGAQWLYIRYLVDRFATDTTVAAWNTFTKTLLATTLTGAPNINAATGGKYTLSVTQWALANWVSDLDRDVPGFVAPPELRYRSWSPRAIFDSLHTAVPAAFPKPFPIVPTASRGDSVSLSSTVRAGSGVYHRIVQGATADAGFTLLFSSTSGGPLPANVSARLNVIRTR